MSLSSEIFHQKKKSEICEDQEFEKRFEHELQYLILFAFTIWQEFLSQCNKREKQMNTINEVIVINLNSGNDKIDEEMILDVESPSVKELQVTSG